MDRKWINSGFEYGDEIVHPIRSAEEFQLRRYFDHIAAGLMNVLDMKFDSPFSCETEEYIAKTLRNADHALNRGDIEEAKRLILIPAKLLQCLLTIREGNEALLQEFKNKFHEVEFDRYYGVRCEVETARSLLEHGLEFKHPDPPDFIVTPHDTELSIECTSIHVETSMDFRQKICDKIGEKNGKYTGGLTTLFIDVTNIIHHSFKQASLVKKQDLKSWIREDTEIFNWEIGSVLLWSYVYDHKTERYHHAYIRSDTPNIADELEQFLDQHYTLDEFEGEEFAYPSQG